ncbi:hypothetical protein GCM10010885_05110 [Alicyclobacillus cellulosilyticus]|uniref:Uncharacterized protein n=1 Tax=Alicyclobacillus cellulosilyticus TaxID=1003997 RepID=A0A917K4E2_9BACL|nr:hypothetical protein GCM10010885_05110 [Alicyclobacillus cellulosilyticus]
MVAKECPSCKKVSYGSYSIRKWICPYCQTDLSTVSYCLGVSAIHADGKEDPQHSPSQAS